MFKGIISHTRRAIKGWQEDWGLMYARLLVSAILGQGVFTKIGYDQWSIGGADFRVAQIGMGQAVGEWVYDRVPHTPGAIYTAKFLEVMFDFGKCPIEGATYEHFGITPDFVACGVTQPLWSLIEATEKLVSFLLNLDNYRQVDEEEFKVAISCIYGSLFRYGLAGLFLVFGPQIDRYMTRPLARLIRRTGPLVPATSIGFGVWSSRGVIKQYRRLLAARS